MTSPAEQEESRSLRYWQAELEALQSEMRRDPRIILLGEDIAGAAGMQDYGIVEGWGGPFGTTRGLVQEFGRQRVLDTPISEAGFLGAAVGLAQAGYRPWVEIMFPAFFGVCFDQLLTNIAQHFQMFGQAHRLPVVVKTMINHHGVLYALAAHIPGLKVVAPSSAYMAKGLMTSALRDDDPVLVFDNVTLLRKQGAVPERTYTVSLGDACVLSEGTDVTLVGISAMVDVCLRVAAELKQTSGISCEVVDLVSISPIDTETIKRSVAKTGRLVVVDEDYPACSVAKEVVALVASQAWSSLKAAPATVTPPPLFRPVSSALVDSYLPSPAKVAAAVSAVVTTGSAVPSTL